MIMKLSIWLPALALFAACDGPIVAQAPTEAQQPRPEFVHKAVVTHNGVSKQKFLNNYQLYQEGWDTLAQARFWQDVIDLTHDSMIVNVASIRKPLLKVATSQWHCLTETEKNSYKQNLCIYNSMDENTNIFVTSGKKFFFEYKKVLPLISRSLPVFEALEVDPWFAQAILVIESPGKTEARSYVGARGPFQLMPYVAKKYGLVVSKYRDDRTDLEKSAAGAAKLIKNICLPYARKMLDEKGIAYNEKDLWFRLFTLHIYHAGAGNVAAVINKINPNEGGMDLIRTMWRTEAAGFKNESQNYSQIALASLINFDRLISQHKDTVFMIQGDRMIDLYAKRQTCPLDTLAYLNDCLSAYECDLVDGAVPFQYFVEKTARVRKEIEKYNIQHGYATGYLAINESERLHQLGNELMYKRKFNEAIEVFQLGIEKNPIAPATYDSLGRAYRLIGNHDLAIKYAKKSKEVIQNPGAFLKLKP